MTTYRYGNNNGNIEIVFPFHDMKAILIFPLYSHMGHIPISIKLAITGILDPLWSVSQGHYGRN
jgi:hypothetical protein